MSDISELPHNIEAEATVLGGILFENRLFYAKELKADDFYATKHKVIFEAMKELAAKGDPIDSKILSDHLRKKSKLEEVGGASYISGLLGESSSSSLMPNYIRIIKENAIKRQIIEIGRKTEGRLKDADITQIISDMRAFYSGLALMPTLEDIGFFDYAKLIEEGRAYAQKGKETGLPGIDTVVKVMPKELVIIGARVRHGKSSFAYNLLLNFLEKYQEEAFIFFNLDVPSTVLMSRLATIWVKKHKDISYAYKEVLSCFQADRFQSEITEAFVRFDGYGKEKRLALVHTPKYTVEQIIGHAERLAQEKPLGAIFIDYIELIKTTGRQESEELRIAHIVNSLRVASEALSVPIIALAQMNRASVGKEKKGKTIEGRRPYLEGLRYSGRQEQEATTVLGLYNYTAEKIEMAREEGQEYTYKPEETTLEVIPLKNRGGMSNRPIIHNFDMVSGYISEGQKKKTVWGT